MKHVTEISFHIEPNTNHIINITVYNIYAKITIPADNDNHNVCQNSCYMILFIFYSTSDKAIFLATQPDIFHILMFLP